MGMPAVLEALAARRVAFARAALEGLEVVVRRCGGGGVCVLGLEEVAGIGGFGHGDESGESCEEG